MTTILNRKPNASDSEEYLIQAVLSISRDKNERVLLKDDNEWKETKLKEIARLASLLNTKIRRRFAKQQKGETR
jgi:hypothetical protein